MPPLLEDLNRIRMVRMRSDFSCKEIEMNQNYMGHSFGMSDHEIELRYLVELVRSDFPFGNKDWLDHKCLTNAERGLFIRACLAVRFHRFLDDIVRVVAPKMGNSSEVRYAKCREYFEEFCKTFWAFVLDEIQRFEEVFPSLRDLEETYQAHAAKSCGPASGKGSSEDDFELHFHWKFDENEMGDKDEINDAYEVEYEIDDKYEIADPLSFQSERAEKLLPMVLANGPRPISEIRVLGRAQGISRHSLKRAAKRLGVITIKEKVSGRYLWTLPKTVSEQSAPSTVQASQNHAGSAPASKVAGQETFSAA